MKTTPEQEKADQEYADAQKASSETGIVGQIFWELSRGFNPLHQETDAEKAGWDNAAKQKYWNRSKTRPNNRGAGGKPMLLRLSPAAVQALNSIMVERGWNDRTHAVNTLIEERGTLAAT